MIFDKYPYTNFHEMNDDWIIQTLRAFDQRLDEFVSANSLTYADPLEYAPATTYPANTVVLYNGVAYVSKQAVPAGLLPTADSDYWLEIFPFGELIEQVMSESMAVVTQRIDAYLEAASAQIAQLEDDVDAAISNIPASVNAWMAANPEITTTVQNGSITFPKLASQMKQVILAGYDESANSTPINKSEFVQGGLSLSGETSATNACRTGYMQFDRGILQIRAASGYFVKAWKCTMSGSVISVSLPAIDTNFEAMTVDAEHQYRFVIMRSDSAAFSPADLPDIPLWYYFESPRYAEQIGNYPYMTVGDAEQLVSAERVVNKTPYNFRITCDDMGDVGNHVLETLVGGTINWNQLCNGSSTSVANGHKYVARIDGSWSVGISNGTALSTNASTDNVFDITRMFGSVIADYIYTLEQTTPGSGVAYFRKLFPKKYYNYTLGGLQSVRTSEHRTVGFNLLKSFIGRNTNTLLPFNKDNAVRVVEGKRYEFNHGDMSNASSWRHAIICYDLDGVKISGRELITAIGTGGLGYNVSGAYFVNSSNGTRTAEQFIANFDGYVIPFIVGGDTSATTKVSEPCVHLIRDGERNGDYEPYTEYVYTLNNSLTLRGMPKLDGAGNLYYDGDTYESDGKITRYYAERAYQAGDESLPDAITDGSTTVYKLSTPDVTYVATFMNPQIVNSFGTEEYVDYAVENNDRDVAVPVGHVSVYRLNLRDKIERMPDLPDVDGTYVLLRQNGQFSYVPINI